MIFGSELQNIARTLIAQGVISTTPKEKVKELVINECEKLGLSEEDTTEYVYEICKEYNP